MSAPEERYKNVLATLNRIAELCERMEKNIMTFTEKYPLHDSQTSSTIISQSTTTATEKLRGGLEKMKLVPGGTVKISEDWYLHWCRHCLEPFRSADPDPSKCGRRNCRKVGWRTGEDHARKKPKKKQSQLASMAADNTT